MEGKLKLYDNALKVLWTDVIKNSDRMSSVESDCMTHWQLIQRLVAADTAKKPEWTRLGVTSGAIFTNKITWWQSCLVPKQEFWLG